MKFCSHCGAALSYRVPPGDNRERAVCPACNRIHYQNPRIVAGCIPEWEGRVLLCRRAIEPRYGLWTLPAGFMENDETSMQAAARETLEEANARVEVMDLYTLLNLPHVNQVYMMFRSKLIDPDFSPGAESLEARLFKEQEIPWDELAFPTVRFTLEFFFSDRSSGNYRFRVGDVLRDRDNVSRYRGHRYNQ